MEQINQVVQGLELPKMSTLCQLFSKEKIHSFEFNKKVEDSILQSEIRNKIKPNMTIAVPVGSRGITKYKEIVKQIIRTLESLGASPFIIPSMGSHGGGTEKGQLEILKSLGVTEKSMGCPIKSSMDTVDIGKTKDGISVWFDSYASTADGVLLLGRIKPHTSFRGEYESGLIKMATIGMGNHKGAQQIHRLGFHRVGDLLPQYAQVIFDKIPILGGIGIVENAYEETCIIEGLSKEEIWTREPKLLKHAKKLLGQLYFSTADILLVDEIGKNYSGEGMDPNVTGRFATGIIGDFHAKRLVALGLSKESHGNATGIGMADVTTKKLVQVMNQEAGYLNSLTSTELSLVKLPFVADNDKQALQVALATCGLKDIRNARIIRIPNTSCLDHIQVSVNMLKEIQGNPNLEVVKEKHSLVFDENNNIVPFI